MSDQELIARIASQESSALDTFYRSYRLLVLSIARRIVADEWDAEEVLQDVVWTVWRKASALRPNTNLKAWVAQVTKNAALMLLRRRRRVPVPLAGEALDLALDRDDAARLPAADDVAASRQGLRVLSDALARLDATNRALFLALEVDGDERDVVAHRLGLTESALKARLHRIRQAVRTADVGACA